MRFQYYICVWERCLNPPFYKRFSHIFTCREGPPKNYLLNINTLSRKGEKIMCILAIAIFYESENVVFLLPFKKFNFLSCVGRGLQGISSKIKIHCRKKVNVCGPWQTSFETLRNQDDHFTFLELMAIKVECGIGKPILSLEPNCIYWPHFLSDPNSARKVKCL